ncbi:hypothetical protein [uncultured Microbacterium sp.]|uniref:hypothetical protein n=1 Tax=uncultured Microbacterium sp. TaxID=191216 RepID=UPI00260FA7E5|nr:hypothetical protein [uncultured Microbacterium sp.]
MTILPSFVRTTRPADASVVTSAVGIAGARHEVLPPRRVIGGGLLCRAISRAAPP